MKKVWHGIAISQKSNSFWHFLWRKHEVDRQIILAQEELALLQKQNTFLSNRIELMRSGQVDPDILAETARAEFGLYASDDVIITIDIKDLKF